MAIVRCANHKPLGRTRKYTLSVEPIGYPHTALVCGRKDCVDPGLIWLENTEAEDYSNGSRIFEAFVGSAMKMRAKD